MAGKINTVNDATLEALQDAANKGIIDETAIAEAILSGNNGASSTKYSPDYQSVQTVGPSTTTSNSTTTGESNTTQTSSTTQSGRSYTDVAGIERDPVTGRATEASLAAKAAEYNQPLENAYRTFGQVVGANANKIRAQRAQEALMNQKRARIAALADSGRVISDMISAGVGGNVYKRDKDTTAKEAYEANQQLKRLQEAEDAALAQQQWKNNLDLAMQKMANKREVDKLGAVNVSESGSNSTSSSNTTSSQQTNGTSYNSGHNAVSGYEERPVVHNDKRTVTANGKTIEVSEAEMNSIRAGVLESLKGKSADEKARILQAVGAVQNRDGSVDFPNGITITDNGTMRAIGEPVARVLDAHSDKKVVATTKGASTGVNRAATTTTTAGRNRAAGGKK